MGRTASRRAACLVRRPQGAQALAVARARLRAPRPESRVSLGRSESGNVARNESALTCRGGRTELACAGRERAPARRRHRRRRSRSPRCRPGWQPCGRAPARLSALASPQSLRGRCCWPRRPAAPLAPARRARWQLPPARHRPLEAAPRGRCRQPRGRAGPLGRAHRGRWQPPPGSQRRAAQAPQPGRSWSALRRVWALGRSPRGRRRQRRRRAPAAAGPLDRQRRPGRAWPPAAPPAGAGRSPARRRAAARPVRPAAGSARRRGAQSLQRADRSAGSHRAAALGSRRT